MVRVLPFEHMHSIVHSSTALYRKHARLRRSGSMMLNRGGITCWRAGTFYHPFCLPMNNLECHRQVVAEWVRIFVATSGNVVHCRH